MASELTIARLDAGADDFEPTLERLLDRGMITDAAVSEAVAGIIADVRQRGDAAVLDYTRRFDPVAADSMAALEVSPAQRKAALAALPAEQARALRVAAERIRAYHQRQGLESWRYQEEDGSVYGQQVMPLERVGVYVPGGKASYPSSMLMTAIPAKVAGVDEVIAVVPTAYDSASYLIFAAAEVAGVDRVFTIGGAQAIAALAYGTETVPRVDKIVGPGNVYVTAAKKQVFGDVAIDMIAGPSELTVICDGQTDPHWIALDLFSQAEHDEQAQSILVSPDADFLEAVRQAMIERLPQMSREAIIRQSLNDRGALILTRDMDEAVAVSNRIAPEHLELSVADPEALLPKIRHAGAIFMGRHTPEALGDYCAGPSHVLPTSGSARFFSPLSVYDFQKRSSLLFCSPQGARTLAAVAEELANNEQLQAHALSAACRARSV